MKFIKITRSDVKGGYTERKENISNAIDGEFDDIEDMNIGDSITLTVVEMSESDYERLPEFTGW